MTTAKPTVFVVDDDHAVRDSLQVLFKAAGIESKSYRSADEFLAKYDPKQPGCLVLDIRMPGMDGVELQRHLNTKRFAIPIIMVSGHGDIRMAVDAVHAGAVDFLEKPLREQVVLERVRTAFARDTELRRRQAAEEAIEERLATLSVREHEVLGLIITGKHNKAIASQLKISHKTVETHRTSIMRKTKAQNVVDLVRMVSSATARLG